MMLIRILHDFVFIPMHESIFAPFSHVVLLDTQAVNNTFLFCKYYSTIKVGLTLFPLAFFFPSMSAEIK